jgi:hypothetical protein
MVDTPPSYVSTESRKDPFVNSTTWVPLVWIGGFLVAFVLILRAVWHNFLVQMLWMVLLYNLGVAPSKIHPHQSGRQKRRDARKDAQDQAIRLRREYQALSDFFSQLQKYSASPESERRKKGPVVWVLNGAGLVEDRSSGGSWMGNSGSLSFPVGHHHNLRYAVGRSYGGYVKAPPTPVVVDVGVTTLTSQRLTFTGQSQTRECSFDKLLGYEFFSDNSGISINTSDQTSTIRIKYGAELGPWFSIRWRFVLAQRNGGAAKYLEGLKDRQEALRRILQ